MASEQVLGVAMPLLAAAEAAAALGASLRLQRDGSTVEPEMAARLDAVLDALGVRDAVSALDEDETVAVLGIVEGFLAQSADFVVEPGRLGWDHEEPSILMAQGHTSVLVASILHRFVVPALDGDVSGRLEGGGAAFLDVGSGVGALSVAVCRMWPSLRVVGVDPWEPALALAREYVAAAGLEERIELRRSVAEALEDSDEFALAWVPTIFIAGAALEGVVERVRATLRPGGWAILGLYARPDDPFAAALADLRTVRHGGSVLTPPEVAALMQRAGFCDVDVHFDDAWKLPLVFVAGRRPDAP